MAPGILSDDLSLRSGETNNGEKTYPKPLKQSGALENFQYEDTTPIIGREFLNVSIVDDLINAPNSDQLLRDLAITISERGVVFFRAQDNLSNEIQKDFVHRLGQLTGKPADSTLHIHPVLNNTSEFGVGDAQISHISSEARKKMFRHELQQDKRRYDSAQWHSDIQFEPVPADYTSLRLTKLPKTGGDTLWASGYELFDRFSKPYQKFFEGLTATFVGDGFLKAAEQDPENVKVYTDPRGSAKNIGSHLSTVHPIIRTNPVTGWKSLYALGPFPKYINELHPDESQKLLHSFKRIIYENHDLTVRFKWRNPNDIGECPCQQDGRLKADRFEQRFGTIDVPSTPPLSTMKAWARGLEIER